MTDIEGLQPEGRIFFSSAGRSMVEENEISLVSVGVDIGSATSHLAFSRLTLEQRDSRYVVRDREMLHQSDILLTPYKDGETIDADVLGAFITAQYEAACLAPSDIDTGALILTGVAVRRANARAIGELFAREAGKFVAVSAGDNLETIMAAHGSGAVARSQDTGQTIANIDIGGGTSKIAICVDGRVADLTAIDVGARLLVVDGDRRVVRMEKAGRSFAAEAGITLETGAVLAESVLRTIASHMADRLAEVIGPDILSPETDALLRLAPLNRHNTIDAISFSGGVAEFIYGYDRNGYGDLGKLLGDEIRTRIDKMGIELVAPVESIRATVIGASQYTVQVSGSTIFISPDDVLPIRNVPVIAPLLPLGDDVLDSTVIAEKTAAALHRHDLSAGHSAVALCFTWDGSATFQRVDALLHGIVMGLEPVLDAGHPLVLVSDGDVGGVLGIHCREEMALPIPVVSIDGIDLKEFDYIDIGGLLPSSGAVPVVIKSLVFPKSDALGRTLSETGVKE